MFDIRLSDRLLGLWKIRTRAYIIALIGICSAPRVKFYKQAVKERQS
jgi:hypothetical protein